MVSITCAVHDFPAMSGHPQHTFNTTISQEESLIIDAEYLEHKETRNRDTTLEYRNRKHVHIYSSRQTGARGFVNKTSKTAI
jgi:hypothetical protein